MMDPRIDAQIDDRRLDLAIVRSIVTERLGDFLDQTRTLLAEQG